MSKLRLGFYPYTYARLAVMKGDLIKQTQWDNLLKMGINELLRYLQDSGYKTEIDALGMDKRNLASLENALNTNLMRIFTKLKRISDEKVQKVLEVYLSRYDMENIKSIVRGKLTQTSGDEIKEMLLPSINHDEEYFLELMKIDDLGKLFKKLELDIKGKELFEIENSIDKKYYDDLFNFAKNIKGQGKPFKEFIEAELHILNIKMLLRLKKEEFSKEEIGKYLINPDKRIENLIEIEKIQDIVKELQKLGFVSKTIKIEDTALLTQVEIDLDINLLKKEVALMHKFPLTVNVILGFMFAKEIEVKNLKILLKGKSLHLEEDYLQSLLGVA
tara:strand:- start:1181 stop:2173 length:993 start_codon:yes stop_codon:yes gene_type:complete